ncbi:hypothetical protein ACIBEJ_10035 [Nonomuraea sp. NPDC050790]|uniref:hypothetical protein n=1 Tax=Nonomuraea sp. NPDC050790 TaxID=3364371 RepID=UPI0037B3A1D5
MTGHGTSRDTPLSRTFAAHLPTVWDAESDDYADEHVTQETPAVRAVRAFIDEYSHPGIGEVRTSGGRGLAIAGDYGTGKTHLAMVAASLAFRTVPDMRVLAIDGSQGSFPHIYRRRIVESIPQKDMFALVRRYYANVMAAELRKEPIFDDELGSVPDQLERGILDPDKVMDHFQLAETYIRQALQRQLREVADHALFGRALALMVSRTHRHDIWNWLKGGEPSAALKDRGLRALNDADTYDALGVIAFLHRSGGPSQGGICLIIDEFEELLVDDGGSRWNPAAVRSFGQLLKIFIDVGGLFVFCALPASITRLPGALRERIGVVPLDTLDLENTQGLIDLHATAMGPEVQVDGSVDLVRYVHTITGGHPRRSLTLTRRSRDNARALGRPLRLDDILDAVRQEFERMSLGDLRRLVRRLLQREQWDFFADRVLGEGEPIDMWLPDPGGTMAVAVLITDSVVLDSHFRALTTRVQEAQSSAVRCEIVLVVDGIVSARLTEAVERLISRSPVIYSDTDFKAEFVDLVRVALTRLGTYDQREFLDEISRKISGQLAEQRIMQQTLDRLLTMSTRPQAISASTPADVLPMAIEGLFADARQVAEKLTEGASEYALIMDKLESNDLREHRPRPHVDEIGTRVVLLDALDKFHDAIARHLNEPRHGHELRARWERRLDNICLAYRLTFDSLPLPQPSLLPPPGGSRTDAGDGAAPLTVADVRTLRDLGRVVSGAVGREVGLP